MLFLLYELQPVSSPQASRLNLYISRLPHTWCMNQNQIILFDLITLILFPAGY
jgi:hypothetical protein